MADLHARPWALKNLGGKYYGTKIADATGKEIPGILIWFTGDTEELDAPSEREDEDFDPTHYENVACYELAKFIVEAVNSHEVMYPRFIS